MASYTKSSDCDSFRGFLNRLFSDSRSSKRMSRFAMGSPVSLRDRISMRRRFGRWRGARATPVRAVACWHLRRSTTAVRGAMRRGSAVSVCRRCATGCCGSTRRGRPVLSTARRRGRRRSSTRPSARRLARIVESGPIPAVHGVVRWRLIDLRPMGLGRVPGYGLEADPELGNCLGDGFPQAVRPAASSGAATNTPWRRSKKLPRPRGGYCTAQRSRRTNRDMVPG